MNKFNFVNTEIEWLIVVEPQVFWDERGFFMETYNKQEFSKWGINIEFVQDNHSKSKKWVFRWLHFQIQNTQSKLVRVVAWSVMDYALDLRKWSDTYWKLFSILLSAENKKQLFIPKWFAHWFLTLEDDTEFVYKCDDIYNPNAELWILWYDVWIDFEQLKSEYEIWDIIISEKDQKNIKLEDFDSCF